jgi:hypothetical protein
MAAGTTSLNSPWARIVNSTIRDYLREEEINILRNRKTLALMKKRGRISYNHSGTAVDWKVRYRRAPLVGFADGDTVTFARQDRDKTAAIDWRGYSASDAMTKGEFLQNRKASAIIKLFDSRTKILVEDVEEQFSEQIWVDGSLPANAKAMHGIETFLNYGTVTAGNAFLLPTAVYGGINCAPGAYGGSWSASGNLQWPHGKGDQATGATYDFWSPLILDVGDTTYWGASATWGGATNPTCVEAVALMIIKSKKSPSKKGTLDLCFEPRPGRAAESAGSDLRPGGALLRRRHQDVALVGGLFRQLEVESEVPGQTLQRHDHHRHGPVVRSC